VAAQEATKAIALAARPEAERLVLAVKLARKREETAGISPVVCGVASVVRVCEDSVAEGCSAVCHLALLVAWLAYGADVWRERAEDWLKKAGVVGSCGRYATQGRVRSTTSVNASCAHRHPASPTV
jgi:hypothetical protein